LPRIVEDLRAGRPAGWGTQLIDAATSTVVWAGRLYGRTRWNVDRGGRAQRGTERIDLVLERCGSSRVATVPDDDVGVLRRWRLDLPARPPGPP
jgi:hypothetical protein